MHAMAAREMFRKFYRDEKWFEAVFSRAWESTLRGLRVSTQPLVFSLAVAFVGFVVTAVSTGLTTAKTNVAAAALTGVGAFAVFWVWFGVNVVLSARAIYYEQRDKIQDLESVLANRPRSSVLNANPGE